MEFLPRGGVPLALIAPNKHSLSLLDSRQIDHSLGVSPAQQTGLFVHSTQVSPFSFAELLNKSGQLYLQPADPPVVCAGRLDVALRVDHRGVPQPFLQHRDRHATQNAVAAVSGPEGVWVCPGRVDPCLLRRVLHDLADSLARNVDHLMVMVLAVERRQVAQALTQVGRHLDLPPFASLVAGRVGPHHDDWRVLFQAQVHTPQRQSIRTLRPVLSIIRKAMRVG